MMENKYYWSKATGEYKWSKATAQKVVERFCLADNALTHSVETNQLERRWGQTSCLADALMDKFKIDINSDEFNERLKTHRLRDWPAGKLLNSIIDIAEKRRPPVFTA